MGVFRPGLNLIMKKNIIAFWILISSVFAVGAQNVKEVSVSGSAPYEEAVEVPCDEKGLTLNVRMIFDEENDVLSLSLVPNRPVIFYRQDVVYKDIFGLSKKLKVEKMPYPVQMSPASSYTLLKTLYKQYPKKKKSHAFNRWLGNVSANMQELCPEITEAGEAAPMVTTDSLFRRFKISSSASRVSFKLRSVQTVDLVVKNKNGKSKYSITGEADLNTTFNVSLERNPCYGASQLKSAVDNQIAQVRKAYHRLLEACPGGNSKSEEECAVFNEHRKYLETQFPVLDLNSECPDIIAACEQYNAYVDSIQKAPCVYTPQADIEDILNDPNRVPSDVLVVSARKLNSMAVQVLMTHDVVEKKDVYDQGRMLIDEIIGRIRSNGVTGDDQEQAVELFFSAVDFWNKTVSRVNF